MRRKAKDRSGNATQRAPMQPEFDVRAEIAALKERIERLETGFDGENNEDLKLAMRSFVPVTRRGPKTKHSSDMHENRDMFVRFLEQHWPEIEPLCGPKPKVRELQALLSSFPIERFGQHGETAQKLSDRINYLKEFLSTPKYRERYRNDPRVLAGALAGVPGVGLWRSLKLCPPRTCIVGIGDPAMRSYLRRKHPDVYRRLTASTDSIHVTAWWREYRTRDKVLKQYNAVSIIRAWNAGSPSTRG